MRSSLAVAPVQRFVHRQKQSWGSAFETTIAKQRAPLNLLQYLRSQASRKCSIREIAIPEESYLRLSRTSPPTPRRIRLDVSARRLSNNRRLQVPEQNPERRSRPSSAGKMARTSKKASKQRKHRPGTRATTGAKIPSFAFAWLSPSREDAELCLVRTAFAHALIPCLMRNRQ
jgi:hypothetical protein